MKYKLSVIIPSFNTAKVTLECVRSVFSEGSKFNCEVIVVDNASVDETVSLLEKIKRSNFLLIKNKDNLGFAKAVNIGIRKAKGQYLLILNSDARLKKGVLTLMVEFAQKRNDVGAVVPRLINDDGSIQDSVYKFPTLARAIKQYLLGIGQDMNKYCPKEKKAVDVQAAVMAAFMLTPQALKSVGLLDERYFMYFEDIDYCKRLKDKGLKVVYLPNALVYHKHGESGKSLVDDKEQWKRLIPSSKIYYGKLKYYLLFLITWLGQKIRK